MLAPPLSVTLFNSSSPMLTLSQISRFSLPSATYAIVTTDGRRLALVRRNVLSRLGRNRWQVLDGDGDRFVADAREESLARALIRKVAGKFNRSLETNVVIRARGRIVGTILRRPDATGAADVLDLHDDELLDRRVAVALATLVLGADP